MNNFLRLSQGLQVLPLLLSIKRQNELWDVNKLRTTHPGTPHAEAHDIWLRFNEMPEPGQETRVVDEHESINYPAWFSLPEARVIILDLMRFVGGERLGRVLVTKLVPGAKIAPHEDGGSHAEYYSRFHVVLESSPGVIFRCGDERVYMAPGDVWWFNNRLEHEVINNSASDRIHMIVDIKVSE